MRKFLRASGNDSWRIKAHVGCLPRAYFCVPAALRGVASLVDCEIPSSSIKTAAFRYRNTKQIPTIRRGVKCLTWLVGIDPIYKVFVSYQRRAMSCPDNAALLMASHMTELLRT